MIEDPGTHCKCGKRFEVCAGMFHWRGVDFSGLVCDDCNALWNNPKDSFLAHVENSGSPRSEET